MAYQSLYRRYRPRKFAEIKGQPHVVAALQNAVARNEVGHAYLFHGPRGTGKTTSARVLAKALNCENLGDDAEPCGVCESCVAIDEGRSFDLHELDAASNNLVGDMRDLLAKVNLGTPGRAKVYILDEVHMLTRGAENALLKTLEEPPEHVIWVLATTEPHKVVETVRSRCQVFQLNLLGAEEMTEHVRWVITDAGLEVGDDAVDHVVSVGAGSVRDTLSALDRVVAAGGVVEIDESTDQLLDALASRDAAGALAAVGAGMGRGRDPRTIGVAVLAGLRQAFLTAMGAPPPTITAGELVRAERLSESMTPAFMTRALETLGTSLVDMRQAPDPRVDLEVALVRLCRADADRSIDSLVERLDQLEIRLSGQPGLAVAPPSAAQPPPPVPPSAPRSSGPPPELKSSRGPAAAARAALADATAKDQTPSSTPSASSSTPAMPPPPQVDAAPGKDDDVDLRALRPSSPREVVELAGHHLGLGRDHVVDRANELLGPSDGPRPVDDLVRLWVTLVGEAGEPVSPGPAGVPGHDEDIDLTELVDAPARADEVVERLSEAFPGAELHIAEDDEQ